MTTANSRDLPEPTFHLPTLRMLVVPLFRHRTAVLVTFFACLSAVAVLVATRPRVYEAEMKVLVNRERADSVMTPDAQSGQRLPNEVTESELYVEVELIRSREVLERVVKSIGVDTLIAPEMAQKAQRADARLAAAVAALRRDLSVDLVRKTTLIRIAYRSKDPQLAARLLSTLSTVYLEKHLAVHRPAGAYDFFSEQTRRYEQELHQAQQALSDFSSIQLVVTASTEKDIVLHNLSEFQNDFDRSRATIADLTRRLEDIESQLRTTPERQITQVRDSGNIELLRTLKGQILQLEGTRNEMLTKFTPQYPPVVQLEERLVELRKALHDAEQTPLRDETTDQNPTSQWLRTEVARVRSERAALEARTVALRRTIAEYTARATRLEALGLQQDQLLRAVKTAEENQSLYRRKQEEARVSDALDRTRIANVAVAESPVVPQRPASSRRAIYLIIGVAFSLVLAMASAYLLDALAPVFYSGDEVTRLLDIPVLATMPSSTE